MLHIDKQMRSQLALLRKPLSGILNVVRFNWPKYLVALIISFAASYAFVMVSDLALKLAILLPLILLLHWTIASLMVSYLVYDESDLYKFNWLIRLLSVSPRTILNLHAGFDETSEGLRMLFPKAKLTVFDFYTEETSSEKSIARARSANKSKMKAVSVSLRGWDLPEHSQDLVLVFLAAHELRTPADRQRFFDEITRVLAADGNCIVVEHLRNPANFLAYGPGFFHFWPRSEWLRLAKVSGLNVREETSVTPYVSVFCLCK